MSDNKNIWEELRKPFPKQTVGILPKLSCKACSDSPTKACVNHSKTKCQTCGNYISTAHIHLDFVGHAAVTDRLNSVVGPEGWSLEPMAVDDSGNPKRNDKGELWCWLTIKGARKMCVGDGATSSKELIGDALRNGAMRFGIALDLWSKDELESTLEAPELKNEKPSQAVASNPGFAGPAKPAPTAASAEPVSMSKLRAAFIERKMIGPAVTKFNQEWLGKDKPETEQDVTILLKALNDMDKQEAA